MSDSKSSDSVTIIIKYPESPPAEITGISSFELITVPVTDPENGTDFYTNMKPEGLIASGAWLISFAKSLRDGTPPPAFGEVNRYVKNFAAGSVLGRRKRDPLETGLTMEQIERNIPAPGSKSRR